MIRQITLVAAAAATLTACAASPEMLAIRDACANGNLDACFAAESLDQARRARMAAAMQAAGDNFKSDTAFVYGAPSGPMTIYY